MLTDTADDGRSQTITRPHISHLVIRTSQTDFREQWNLGRDERLERTRLTIPGSTFLRGECRQKRRNFLCRMGPVKSGSIMAFKVVAGAGSLNRSFNRHGFLLTLRCQIPAAIAGGVLFVLGTGEEYATSLEWKYRAVARRSAISGNRARNSVCARCPHRKATVVQRRHHSRMDAFFRTRHRRWKDFCDHARWHCLCFWIT